MPVGRAFLKTDSILQRALDAQALRLQAISHNLANANTPQFKRAVVTFEAELRRELSEGEAGAKGISLAVTHPRHLPGRRQPRKAEARWSIDDSTSMRNDGNNVDPEREMAELARTQLAYQALARMASEHYRRVRTVIQQGGR